MFLFLKTAQTVFASSVRSMLAVAAGIVGVAVLAGTMSSDVEAKVPGKTYCYKRVCHRVHTIKEMVLMVGRDELVLASHYDDCKRDRYNPCGLTSSGEAFRANAADNAASPEYPNGTVLLVRNPATGQAAVVRVNNSGPYWGKRKLDVSRATAEKLGFRRQGVAKLEVRVVSAPTRADTRYKKNRRYTPVPGAIGKFASLGQAQGGMMVALALDAMSGSVFAPSAGKMLPSLKSATPALAKLLTSDVRLAAERRAAARTKVALRANSPAEGLKAAARRLYGEEKSEPIEAPSSLLALAPLLHGNRIAPIHRSRRSLL